MDKYCKISEKLTQILNTLMEESKKNKEMPEKIEADSRETKQMPKNLSKVSAPRSAS